MRNKILADLSRSLNLGRESAEVEMTEEQYGATEDETVSANSIENIAEDQATEEIIEESTDGIDASEDLDELAVVVESHHATGKSLSRVEAAALRMTIQQVGKKHFKDPLAALPARESTSELSVSDLHLATEGLKESAGNLIKSIIEQIKKIVAAVVDFLSRIIDKYRWLTNRAKKVYAAATSVKEIVPGSVNVDAKFMGTGGEIDLESVSRYIKTIESIEASTHFNQNFDFLKEILKEPTMAVSAVEGETAHTKIFSDINTQVKDKFDSISGAGFKVHGPGSKLVAENVKAFVELPGDRYYGFEDIEGKGLFCPVFDKMNREYDADAARTNLAFPDKENLIDYARTLAKATQGIGNMSTRTMRNWKNGWDIKDIQTKSGNVGTRADTAEKESAKLVLKYVKGLTTLRVNADQFNFGFISATLDWLEAAMRNKEIEGEAA